MKKSIKIYLVLYSLFLLFLMMNPVSAIFDDYIYYRENITHNAIATTGSFANCGYPLVSYHKSGESGCLAYQGGNCNISMIGGTSGLSIIWQQPVGNQYNYSSPIWAYPNVSCAYYGVNSSDNTTHIFRAWKVKSSAGQFCTIQNKWDYYIYDVNFTTETLPLSIDNSYNGLFELSGYCQLYVPNLPATPYPSLFILDFTQKIYLLILIIFFIIILLLIYFKYLMYASVIIIIWGFIFLFSGVNILIAFLVVAIGTILASIFGGKK
jgi:hypothetical protein